MEKELTSAWWKLSSAVQRQSLQYGGNSTVNYGVVDTAAGSFVPRANDCSSINVLDNKKKVFNKSWGEF